MTTDEFYRLSPDERTFARWLADAFVADHRDEGACIEGDPILCPGVPGQGKAARGACEERVPARLHA